eukprot:TRINITY_DN2906_c0_g1_i2.p1 TRINITY_DN2906_c0_g1~~TRINITY_DN2906_c0_g1_i2.p1  ORF type:complete len:211 (+),score=74.44 TRINITY_DN2906_c0_g1_i2:83-715(+)
MADEDDVPPPLEDMSEMVKRIHERAAKSKVDAPDGYFAAKDESKTASTLQSSQKSIDSQSTKTTKPKEKQSEFGLKRGFLNSTPKAAAKPSAKPSSTTQSEKPKSAVEKSEEIEEIIRPKAPNAKPSANQAPVFPEIQQLNQSMGSLFSSPKFLDKLAESPQMMKEFSDPEVKAAFDEMSRDPTAILRHQANPKIRAFFGKFGEFLQTID